MTGEKTVILEMHASGAALHEVVSQVDRPPGVVINYLVREGVIAHPTPYTEARKTLPEMQKRLNDCGLTFANVAGAGFSLADWAAYYKKPLVDVFESAIGCGPGNIRAKLRLDMHVLGERQAKINREKVEFNERMKPVHYFREVETSWSRLYDRQKVLPVFFEGPKKQALISLQITGGGGSELFLLAMDELTLLLAGFLSERNFQRVGDIQDPELYHYQQGSWDADSQIAINLNVCIGANLDTLDSMLKSWSSKFCFVLKSFQYISQEIKVSCVLNLDQVVEQKLEDGEK